MLALELAPAVRAAPITTLGMCAYFTLSPEEEQFIAPRFKWVVTGDDGAPARLHALNRRVRVLKYFDALFTGQDETGYREDEYLIDPERMSRLEPSGKRWPLYAMDVSSPAWRATAVSRARAAIAKGFDGMHLDEVRGDLADPLLPPLMPVVGPPYTSVPSWYSKSSYQQGMSQLLKEVHSAIGRKSLIYNGINPLAQSTGLEYEPYVSGAVQEGWVYNDHFGQGYASGELWSRLLTDVLAAPSNKLLAVISYGKVDDVQARIYALASYLLISRSNTTFYYSPECDELTYLPEWELKLGKPKGQVGSLSELQLLGGQVYARTFSRGLVLVNPGDSSAPAIQLNKRYSLALPAGGDVPALGGDGTLSLIPVSSVTLPPHSAAILVSAR